MLVSFQFGRRGSVCLLLAGTEASCLALDFESDSWWFNKSLMMLVNCNALLIMLCCVIRHPVANCSIGSFHLVDESIDAMKIFYFGSPRPGLIHRPLMAKLICLV